MINLAPENPDTIGDFVFYSEPGKGEQLGIDDLNPQVGLLADKHPWRPNSAGVRDVEKRVTVPQRGHARNKCQQYAKEE